MIRKSGAKVASASANPHGIGCSDNVMVQIIVGNLDTNISSPNGKLSTHSLAMILTQHEVSTIDSFDRLTHTESKVQIADDEADFIQYAVTKKPPMPDMPRLTL